MLKYYCAIVVACLNVTGSVGMLSPYDHFRARQSIIELERKEGAGGQIMLTKEEARVDDLLLKIKQVELEQGFRNVSQLAAAMHFFHAKPLIEKSKVFKFLKRMPKGGFLHGHDSAMVSSEWLLDNIFVRDDLRFCNTSNKSFFTFKKSSRCATVTNLKMPREKLSSMINLYTPTPDVDYPNVDVVWKRFQAMFEVMSDIFKFKPVFQQIFRQTLQELYDDNIMYVELRSSFSKIYDENERDMDSLDLANDVAVMIDQFKSTHRGFYGVKYIITTRRILDKTDIRKRIDNYKKLKNHFPWMFIGFDLVGQEDRMAPLASYVHDLKMLMPEGTRYYFHAGETNWLGKLDLNMVDAILQNTSRIAHGYALAKHPVLIRLVKQCAIAIEVCPISNQVLGLVRDLRNHPAAVYLSQNIPVVISSDDPGFWNARGISYDFYYAFMAMTPYDSGGLATLKQLAINSIYHTGLEYSEWINAMAVFNYSWSEFLIDMLENTDYILGN